MDDMISKQGLKPIISAQLRRLRKAHGLSQEQLAAKAGVVPLTIVRIENGIRVPDAALLFTLADILDVPADAFRQLTEKAAVPA